MKYSSETHQKLKLHNCLPFCTTLFFSIIKSPGLCQLKPGHSLCEKNEIHSKKWIKTGTTTILGFYLF